MNCIREITERPRALFVVVHATSPKQAVAQSELALEAGADGVFLISHGPIVAHELVRVANRIASEAEEWFPGRVVGVNLLELSIADATTAVSRASRDLALWVDDVSDLRFLQHRGRTRSWPLFGGVAFKYRAPVPAERWGEVARDAATVGVDVITTSGDRTGEPPPVAKVRAMRQAIGDHALAVASGVAVDNVAGLLPYVDAFLVASSLERSHGELELTAVCELANAVHGYGVKS